MKESWVKGIVMQGMLLSLIVIAGCATRSPATDAPAPGIPASPSAKQDQVGEWDSLIREAKREGTLTVFGAEGGEMRSALSQSFQGKFDVSLDYMAAPGPSLVPKIVAQRNAGLFLVDILLGAGAPGTAVLKPAGALAPMEADLVLPEVKDPGNWYGGKIPWMDARERTTITFLLTPANNLVINTQMVKPGEIKSYFDLLDPKWKGKIVISDPINPGTFTSLVGLMSNHLLGADYLRKLAQQEPAVVVDVRQHVEWLARGKYAVALAPRGVMVEEFKRAGAPIESIMPVEGTELLAVTGVIRRLDRAPHPNAARLFINWLLNREGQTIYSRISGQNSAREDVPTDHLDPILRRQPGVKYILSNTEEWSLASPQREKLSAEIFGRLLR